MKKILIALTILMMVGCGARKATTNISKVKTKMELVDTTSTVTKINASTNVDFTSLTIVPIDTSKPIIINKIPIKNARIKFIQQSEKDTVTKSITETRGESKTVDTTSRTKSKTTNSNNLYWIIGMVLLGVITMVIYLKFTYF